MSFLEILLIGIGLSVDAVCVSFTNGACLSKVKMRHILSDAVAFGLFQGLMPCIGYGAGSLFVDVFSRFSGYLVAAIFFALGGKMLWDVYKGEEEAVCLRFTLRLLLIQAIATSIDALAVGVSFRFAEVHLLSAALVIALTTFLLSALAITFGKKVGSLLQNKVGILGGLLLCGIGLKALIEALLPLLQG